MAFIQLQERDSPGANPRITVSVMGASSCAQLRAPTALHELSLPYTN